MIKNKLAVALLAVILGSTVAGGAIYAYYADVESVDGNQYTAGTMNLVLGGTGTVPASIGPVYPGWGTSQYPSSTGTATTISVENAGTVNGVLYLNFTSVTSNDNGITDPEGKFNLVPGEGGDTTNGAGNGELQQYLYVEIKCGSTEVMAPTALSSIGSSDILLCNLHPGDSKVITVTYYVPSTVGNVIQSDSVAFDMVFNLEQDRTAAV